MKKQFLFLAATIFFIHAANAQTMASVVSTKWTGISESASELTKTGKMLYTSVFDLSVNSNDRVSGTEVTTMKLDGVSYSITVNISGSIDASVFQVDLQQTGITQSDQLPDGIRWCTNAMGTLTLYKDTDNPGHYILKGNMKDGCGNVNRTELSDK